MGSIQILLLLNHNPKVKYMDYVHHLSKQHRTTRKICDLQHNSNLSRLEKVTEKDLKRVEKQGRPQGSLRWKVIQRENNPCDETQQKLLTKAIKKLFPFAFILTKLPILQAYYRFTKLELKNSSMVEILSQMSINSFVSYRIKTAIYAIIIS